MRYSLGNAPQTYITTLPSLDWGCVRADVRASAWSPRVHTISGNRPLDASVSLSLYHGEWRGLRRGRRRHGTQHLRRLALSIQNECLPSPLLLLLLQTCCRCSSSSSSCRCSMVIPMPVSILFAVSQSIDVIGDTENGIWNVVRLKTSLPR